MESINIQETTSTTGTGDISLGGASESGKTFFSDFVVSERLSYYIDDRSGNWEHGIGYLSGSTTLVRETVIDSSAGGLVNFSAGTKYVFNGKSSGTQPRLGIEIITNNQLISTHIIEANTTATMVSNRVYYMPFILLKDAIVNEIGVSVNSTAGTSSDSLHVGLYLSTGNNYPGLKIESGDDLDPSISGFQTSSFTSRKLKAGNYWVGAWSNVSPGLRGTDIDQLESSDLGFSSSVQFNVNGFQESLSGISTLPAIGTPGITSVLAGATIPTVHLRLVQ